MHHAAEAAIQALAGSDDLISIALVWTKHPTRRLLRHILDAGPVASQEMSPCGDGPVSSGLRFGGWSYALRLCPSANAFLLHDAALLDDPALLIVDLPST